MNFKKNTIRLISFYFLVSLLSFIMVSCSEDSMMDEDPCENGPEVNLTSEDATIGASNGSVDLNITNGTPPYEASLDGGDFQSTTSFSGLVAGNYSVVIRDAEGCEVNAAFTIAEVDPCANGPEISVETTASFEMESSGTISVSAEGGASPYMYKLDDGALGTGSDFTELSAGTYTITVQDDNGCTETMEVEIKEVPFVSYENDIKTIIDTNCLLSGCHGNNDNLPDWGDFSVLQANAEQVKSRTSDGSMPPSNTPGDQLTEDEKQKIANWVDAGAPNN